MKSNKSKTTNQKLPRKERGVVFIEATALFSVTFAAAVGLMALDSYVQSGRALEWAVSEVMFLNDLGKDIHSMSTEPDVFTHEISGNTEPAFNCSPAAPGVRTRCQVAYESALLIHRTVASMLGEGALGTITASFEFENIGSSVEGSSRLSSNRLLAIRVAASRNRPPFSSWLSGPQIHLKEAIG